MSSTDVGFSGLPFVERVSNEDILMERDVCDADRSTQRHVHVMCHTKLQCNLSHPTRVKAWLQLRFDCDKTKIRLQRIARACFHSTRFEIRREQKIKQSCRSRIVVESQLWYRLYRLQLRRFIANIPSPKKIGYVFTFVCMSVCLPVCLSARLLKKLWIKFLKDIQGGPKNGATLFFRNTAQICTIFFAEIKVV